MLPSVRLMHTHNIRLLVLESCTSTYFHGFIENEKKKSNTLSLNKHNRRKQLATKLRSATLEYVNRKLVQNTVYIRRYILLCIYYIGFYIRSIKLIGVCSRSSFATR